MKITMNREEFANLRTVISETGNSTVVDTFNSIFSATPPEGVTWKRSDDKSTISVDLNEDLACEIFQILSRYSSCISKDIGSITAIPRLISNLKCLGKEIRSKFLH